jgi:hypothetical protein
VADALPVRVGLAGWVRGRLRSPGGHQPRPRAGRALAAECTWRRELYRHIVSIRQRAPRS